MEDMVREAARLMQRGEEYLVDAEADLVRVASARGQQLPEVTSSIERTAEARVAEDALALRAKATAGNLPVSPSGQDEVTTGNHRRDVLRSAMARTKGHQAVQAVLSRTAGALD